MVLYIDRKGGLRSFARKHAASLRTRSFYYLFTHARAEYVGTTNLFSLDLSKVPTLLRKIRLTLSRARETTKNVLSSRGWRLLEAPFFSPRVVVVVVVVVLLKVGKERTTTPRANDIEDVIVVVVVVDRLERDERDERPRGVPRLGAVSGSSRGSDERRGISRVA